MTYDEISERVKAYGLSVLGGFEADLEEDLTLLSGFKTVLLLGPDEPRFWPLFKASPEFGATKDPMDLWSKRVVGELALSLDAQAFFPSDGPPYPPFFSWALRSGRCHSSPVQLLVHDSAGMMVSFRGALAFRGAVALPAPPPSPCIKCTEHPCKSACPINVLSPEGYDVASCKDYISTSEGRACMNGCRVRRACPVSQTFGRLIEQSQFHQRAFLKP